MNSILTSISELSLEKPDPSRDAIFAYQWFSSGSGRATLLKMGNTPSEITPSTLEGERSTIEEFLRLEQEHKQSTWVIRYANTTIGAVWIDQIKNHGVAAPSLHLLIGDPSLRGKGIGKAVVSAMLNYLKAKGYKMAYSRYLTSNKAVNNLFESFGFDRTGMPYIDNNGLEWQNVEKSLGS